MLIKTVAVYCTPAAGATQACRRPHCPSCWAQPSLEQRKAFFASSYSSGCPRPTEVFSAKHQPALHCGRARPLRRAIPVRALHIDNRELVTGDTLVLTAFCLYKQITAIILHPRFPGWSAPLHFNYVRFEEFAAFAVTICGAWVLSCLLTDGYTLSSTANIPAALRRVVAAWAVSMPVAACQLVITTASESHALVGELAFADHLPLAASGPAEPLATAAGILGLMAVWRTFYTTQLDLWNYRAFDGSPIDRRQDIAHLGQALRSTALIMLAATICISILDYMVGAPAVATFLQHAFHTKDPLL